MAKSLKVPLYQSLGTVLFPDATLPLVIKAPEDKKIIDCALKTDGRLLAVLQPMDDDGNRLHLTGCLGRIISFHETEEGLMVVALKGTNRFQLIQEEVSNKGCRMVRVLLEKEEEPTEEPFVNRQELISLLSEYLDDMEMGINMEELEDASNQYLINSIAMSCPFDPVEKQAILEKKTLNEQSNLITTFIQMSNPGYKVPGVIYH